MTLHCIDAYRRPLADIVDVRVLRGTTRRLVRELHDAPADRPLQIDAGVAPEMYQVQVWPTRYRPVSQFVASDATATIFCPVDPAKVRGLHVTPTAARALPIDAHRLATLSDEEVACLLNIWAVLGAVTVGQGQPIRSFVSRLDTIRADRIYVDVLPTLPEALAQSPVFTSAPDHLHEPPHGYERAGSYKHTVYTAGALQVTLFRRGDAWMADMDLDDAAGIGHVAQVLEHAVTNGHTNPYDMHQVLTFHQSIDPGYRLLV